jgi:hypothetical protein
MAFGQLCKYISTVVVDRHIRVHICASIEQHGTASHLARSHCCCQPSKIAADVPCMPGVFQLRNDPAVQLELWLPNHGTFNFRLVYGIPVSSNTLSHAIGEENRCPVLTSMAPLLRLRASADCRKP